MRRAPPACEKGDIKGLDVAEEEEVDMLDDCDGHRADGIAWEFMNAGMYREDDT